MTTQDIAGSVQNDSRLSTVIICLISLWIISIPQSITINDTLLLLITVLTIYSAWNENLNWPARLASPETLCVVLLLVTVLGSLKPAHSIIAWKRFLYLPLLVMILSIHCPGPRAMKNIFRISSVAVYIMVLYHVVKYNQSWHNRLYTGYHPGIMGAVCAVHIYGILEFDAARSRWHDRLQAVVMGGLLLWSFSKVVIAALIIVEAAQIMINRTSKYKLAWYGIWCVLLIGILAVIIKSESSYNRLSLWKLSVKIFLDYPWCGVGLNCINDVYHRYLWGWLAMDPVIWNDFHSDWFQALAETGIIGFIALAYLWLKKISTGLSLRVSHPVFIKLLLVIGICSLSQKMIFNAVMLRYLALFIALMMRYQGDHKT